MTTTGSEYVRTYARDAGPLPVPTTDPEQQKRDLDTWGYCLVQDALTAGQVSRLADRLTEQAAVEGERGVATTGDGRGLTKQWSAHADESTPHTLVRSLLNKGEVFRELALNEKVVPLMKHMLGEDLLLSSTNGLVMRLGSRRQICHTDQSYITFPTPVPAVANVLYMITDFDEARGGTRIIPGSHTWSDSPEYVPVLDDDGNFVDIADQNYETIAAEGPAGTALVFEGRLWHYGGENVSGELRLAISTYYCRPFVRQQDNLTMSLNEDTYTQMSDELKALCGFSLNSPGQLGRMDPALGRTNLELELPYIGELHR